MRFTTKDILHDWKSILQLTIPMIIASMVDIILGVTDTMFVGRLGATPLAAVASATAVYSVISQILAALVVGYQITAARKITSRESDELGAFFMHSIILLFIVSFLGILFIWTCRPLLHLITNQSSVTEQALLFLRVRSPGLIIYSIYLILKSTIDVTKKTKWGMYASFISAGCNVILDYFLVFGKGPFPKMGVAGSALASTISLMVSLCFISIVFTKKRIIKSTKLRLNSSIFLSQLKLSGPEMLNASLDYLGNLLFVGLIGVAGIYALAGGRISYQVLLILFIVSTGFSVGVQILLGRSLGRNNYLEYKRLFRNGRLLVMFILSLLGLTVTLFSNPVISLFTPSSVIIHETHSSMMLVGFCAPFVAWTTLHVSVLRSLGKTFLVLVSNSCATWLIHLPVAWFCGIHMRMGLVGCYLGFFFYFLSRALVTHFLSHLATKSQIDTKIRESVVA